MITKGQRVFIRPEWQDKGDENFVWLAMDDEEKGRVTIAPVDIGLAIVPRQVVDVAMLEADNNTTTKG